MRSWSLCSALRAPPSGRTRTEQRKTPPAPPVPPAPAITPITALTVAVDSTRPFTVIERRANTVVGWSITLPVPAYISTSQWEPVCVAPCELHLDLNGIYRVGGVQIAPSGSFTLPRDHDPLRLHVHAGSSTLHDGGIVLTVIGAASVLAGVAFVGESALEADPKGALRARVAFFAPGVAALLVGAVLWITNG